jgi:hypothetical protein
MYLYLNLKNKLVGTGSDKSFCHHFMTAVTQYPQILLVKFKTLYILECLAKSGESQWLSFSQLFWLLAIYNALLLRVSLAPISA